MGVNILRRSIDALTLAFKGWYISWCATWSFVYFVQTVAPVDLHDGLSSHVLLECPLHQDERDWMRSALSNQGVAL